MPEQWNPRQPLGFCVMSHKNIFLVRENKISLLMGIEKEGWKDSPQNFNCGYLGVKG